MGHVAPMSYIVDFTRIVDDGSYDTRKIGSGPLTFEYYQIDPSNPDPYEDSWVMLAHSASTHLPANGLIGAILASDAELDRWATALATAWAGLGAAQSRLLEDLGLKVGPLGRGRGLMNAGGPRPFVRRWRKSSLQPAIDRFVDGFRSVDERYRPIRDQIAAQAIRATRDEEAARARREERIRGVADRARWDCRVDRTARTVEIVLSPDSPWDTSALVAKLADIAGETEGWTLRWKDADRAEIERDSGIDFEIWWRAVTPRDWDNSRRIPVPVRRGFSYGGYGSIGFTTF
ncbi:hypothetical protein AB0L57_06515 [Nocardia sp. NPDC052254]|uniref:hypothetical protein n=1 Tax=Nocardia sp. NPDC052254 TaxID=3155681 RepID=UPI0034426F58